MTFITVTYLTSPEPKEAKRHLHNFLERVRRHAPRAAVIWKMEFQKRGAIHFHFLCWNVPYWGKDKVQEVWGEITGEEKPFTRIEAIRARKHAIAYVCKYMAKSVSSGFNNAPYLHVETGRTWGFHQKENFIYAKKVVIDMTTRRKSKEEKLAVVKAYFELREKASKIFKPIAEYEWIGFSVFTEHAESLIKDLTVSW